MSVESLTSTAHRSSAMTALMSGTSTSSATGLGSGGFFSVLLNSNAADQQSAAPAPTPAPTAAPVTAPSVSSPSPASAPNVIGAAGVSTSDSALHPTAHPFSTPPSSSPSASAPAKNTGTSAPAPSSSSSQADGTDGSATASAASPETDPAAAAAALAAQPTPQQAPAPAPAAPAAGSAPAAVPSAAPAAAPEAPMPGAPADAPVDPAPPTPAGAAPVSGQALAAAASAAAASAAPQGQPQTSAQPQSPPQSQAPAQPGAQAQVQTQPSAQAQAATLSQLTGGAPAGSVKVTADTAAPAAPISAGPATVGQGKNAVVTTVGDTPGAPTIPATGANAGGQTGANTAGGNSPQQDGAAPKSSLTAGGIAPQGVPASATVSAATSSGQTADSASASTQTASASGDSSGTQTPVALGLLGDPTPFQQVPITAQGAGLANSGAEVPPGMDNRTLALDPATGGTPALTGDVASAATAAATQGIVRTEEPSAASAATQPFSLAQAAEANPTEQVKVQVTKGTKDGSDSIDVLLHPADLGTVQVKLQMQDGQVKATITADNPQTLALLKNDAHQLTQSLQDAGFNTDRDSLNFQMRGDQQSSGSAFAQQQQGQGSGSGAGNSSDSGSNATPYTTDSEIDEQVLAATAGNGASASGLDINV